MRLPAIIVMLSLAVAPCCADFAQPASSLGNALQPLTHVGVSGMTSLDEWLANVPAPGFAEDHAQPPANTVDVLSNSADSASLFLAALSSVGVWQLGRSSRKINLSATPDWYHAGGPTQVGYSTPLDLEFTDASLLDCVFSAPSDGWTRRPIDEFIARLKPQRGGLRAAAPRAPPSV